jgi:F-type H+-transporting ATPase subunit epsilon
MPTAILAELDDVLRVRAEDASGAFGILPRHAQAVLGDDLVHLESEVLEAFRRKTAEEQTARAGSARLQLAAMRRIFDYVRPERDATKRLPLGLGARKART